MVLESSNTQSLNNLTFFRQILISWGKENFRTFPWRFTNDPYHILIAEILLHRTQAKQVTNVYTQFINRYPDIISLSKADPMDIKEKLKPLGLYWRSDLIMDLALDLKNDYGFIIPEDKSKLLSLPGVGEYIASSVRCFAFGYPDAIIDTNVMRVITRVYGVQFRDSLRRNHKFKNFAQSLVDPQNPKSYNFALLDLANKICLPKSPNCEICPLIKICNYCSVNITPSSQ